MRKIAVVTAETTVLAGSGHGVRLASGEYEAVDIDGADERHVRYLVTDAHGLVCVQAGDPKVTYRTEEA